jgi:hypothetical protein
MSAREIAEMDQFEAACRNIARYAWELRVALEKQGFTREEANGLVVAWVGGVAGKTI